MIELKLGGAMKNVPFTDISTEQWRTYIFPEEHLPDGRIKPETWVTINTPAYLNVSPSGGHRILDRAGVSHYIPCGWKHLYWLAEPHFVN